jgi:hypothetical protein
MKIYLLKALKSDQICIQRYVLPVMEEEDGGR